MPARVVVALMVVADVALWAIAGRLDVAVHTLLAEQQASGSWPSPDLPHHWIWWVLVVTAIALSIGLAWIAWSDNRRRDNPPHWWFNALAVLSILGFGVWAGWDVVCVTAGGWHPFQTEHDLLGTVLAGLVVGLLIATGAMYGVKLRAAWDLAPVVRVHFLLLGVLIAAAFLFGMTSGQAIDMMRAWTDAGWRLPAAALAIALVLGEMMRESGIRLSAWSDARDLSNREWRVFRLITIMPAGVLFVGAVIAATDSLLLAPISDSGVRRAVLVAVIGGGVIVGLVATVLAPTRAPEPDGSHELILVVDGIVLAVLMPAVRPPRGDRPDSSSTRRRRLAYAAGAAAAGLVGGVLLAVFTVWAGAGLIALTLGFVGYQWARTAFDEQTPYGLPLHVAWGLSVGVGLAVYRNPIQYPRNLGMIAVAFAFAAGLLAVLHALSVLAELAGRRVSGLVDHRVRIPVVLSLVVWFGLATQCTPESQHQARVVAVHGLPTRTTLDVATARWLSDEYKAVRSAGGRPRYLPLLLVADSGGGSKSAYWTDLVLDCLISGGRMQPSSVPKRECARTPPLPSTTVVRRERGLFLTSSVSGGSVGVSRYVLHVPSIANGHGWVDDSTGGDFLAPTVAWGLYHDLPNTVFGWVADTIGIDPSDPTECATGQSWGCRYNLDRAAIQEAAIAGRAWDSVPAAGQSVDTLWQRSLSTTHARSITPLTIFNTAVSGGVGRVLVSPVDLSPLTVLNDQCPAVRQWPGQSVVDAIDAADLYTKRADGTPKADFDATTAGLLSGRFPVVDPVARVGDSTSVVPPRSASQTAPCLDPSVNTLPAEFVRDGGYVENTGLLTIVQALPTISQAARDWTGADPRNPPVVIWVLSIDDDPAFINGRVEPAVQRPGAFSLGTRASDLTLSQLSTESLTVHQGGVSCYGRISPAPGVGAHAASGWLLSKTVRNYDLAASLTTSPRAVQRVTLLTDVRNFLDGRLREPSACPDPLL